MWQNQHLPAVGPGQVNDQGQGLINVGARSQGMLEELEKAHIYIEQLHGEMTENEVRLEKAHRDIEQLQDEVAALEAIVH